MKTDGYYFWFTRRDEFCLSLKSVENMERTFAHKPYDA